ncbi:type IV secretory system conjugative DNA transfer family protein [Rubellimicrobium aerolatum]|uniref:Type IV secretory system conjugative DNA transfer family protein n=1 Tax=Rubellimicrobium aerolatum TaxID=490979 RepID=A0ABW0SDX4_9RHOB|nr:type IV secretory system conjugative DNA transfer family protein [Rubellimicrobium aerolatum]MBP1806992.1 type IV secretion system protein VirD4 [Rubellimicrobium aerolatum]
MDKRRVLAAGLSFSLLGAGFGYALASAYLTQRFGGSLQSPDFLFFLRNFAALRERAPTEFLIAAALVGGCVLFGLALTGVVAQEKLTTFGLTQWQTRAQMKRHGFLGPLGQGFVLGKLGDPKSRQPFLVSTEFPHALLVAPTGRGKGVGFVIPNLLTFRGSVVVLDVKGENFMETARQRQTMGNRVIRFAPADWSRKPSHRYNPLRRIFELKNPDQQLMELRLTAGLFLQTDSPGAAGFLEGAMDIFVAAGMLAFERGTPTLGAIYQIAATGGDKQRAYAKLANEVKNPAAHLLFENLGSTNVDTLTSCISVLMTAGLNAWANPAIQAATATSDFSFRDLRRTPHAVYLEVAPDMVRPLAPLIRLFFADLIASLQAKKPGPDEPWRVMILLDEFDRLGRMPIVAESIKMLRGYGGHLALVTQTIPALDEIYGENTRLSLQGGAGVKVYLTPSDPKTIEELSASTGMTTKRVISKSRPLGPHALKSRTLTERTEDAPLLSEDQARTMSLDDVVVVIDAQNPIRAKRIKYYDDVTLKAVHAAQAGDWPYPDPDALAVAEVVALRQRAEAAEEQNVLLSGRVAQIEANFKAMQAALAAKTAPQEPASPPTPPPKGGIASGPLSATPEPQAAVAAPSARRSRSAQVEPPAPLTLRPVVATEEEVQTLKGVIRQIDSIASDLSGSSEDADEARTRSRTSKLT